MDYPRTILLPTREILTEFCSKMSMLEDQPYSTDEAIETLLNAIRQSQSDLHTVEWLRHYLMQHNPRDLPMAQLYLTELSQRVTRLVHQFQMNELDGTFPYTFTRIEENQVYMTYVGIRVGFANVGIRDQSSRI